MSGEIEDRTNAIISFCSFDETIQKSDKGTFSFKNFQVNRINWLSCAIFATILSHHNTCQHDLETSFYFFYRPEVNNGFNGYFPHFIFDRTCKRECLHVGIYFHNGRETG